MHAMFLLGCSDCFSVVRTERGGGRLGEHKTKLKQSEDTFFGFLARWKVTIRETPAAKSWIQVSSQIASG